MSKNSKAKNKIIHSKGDLVAWFNAACCAPDDLRIGLEHEKPAFYLDNNKPVPYAPKNNRNGIRTFLQEMSASFKWDLHMEGENPVELRRGRVDWTLEPGGQLETSGAPVKSVHESARETDKSIRESLYVARKLGFSLLPIGYHPTHEGKTMPFMPKSRYRIIRRYMPEATAADYLCCTSSIQANLGYTSEADMVKKLRVALSLQPVVTALFANSPFKEGEPSGYQSYRSHMSQNLIEGRYGFMLPIAFEKDFGFEKFVDYVVNDMPMLGIYRDGRFIDAKGGTFAAFMEGKLSILPGEHPTTADWENHLNTIWPEVRLRRVLEMRGADGGPAEMIKALPAFWAGILYDEKSLDAAYDMISVWTHEDRDYLRTEVPETGLQTEFMGSTVQELAKYCLHLAEEGLKRRNMLNGEGQDESMYLAPLHEIAQSGRNWAIRLLERYEGEWKGNINGLFRDQDFSRNPSVLKDATPQPAALAQQELKKAPRHKKKKLG